MEVEEMEGGVRKEDVEDMGGGVRKEDVEMMGGGVRKEDVEDMGGGVRKEDVEDMGGGVRKEDVEVVEGDLKARVGRAGPMPSGKPSSSLARTSSGRRSSVTVGGRTATGFSAGSPAVSPSSSNHLSRREVLTSPVF